jgi:hypothetical protein
MDAVTVIEQARQVGLRIGIRGDQLGVDPIARLSDELRQHIREQRDTIVLTVKNIPGRLVHLAIVAGIHEQGYEFTVAEIRRLQDNQDLRDAINCGRAELQAWASALAIRAVRYRGKVPRGWDQVAHCAQCGPVYSFAAGEYLSCAWCDMKRAGKWFPVPNHEDLRNDYKHK